jgi:hypothetical protein
MEAIIGLHIEIKDQRIHRLLAFLTTEFPEMHCSEKISLLGVARRILELASATELKTFGPNPEVRGSLDLSEPPLSLQANVHGLAERDME